MTRPRALPGCASVQAPAEPMVLDLAELAVRQPWGGARRPLAAQGIGATSLPAGMPVADALAGDLQPAGDLGLAEAGGEQLSSAQLASLAAFTLLLCRSTAGSGWHG
jgi:hypothetical protein